MHFTKKQNVQAFVNCTFAHNTIP